MKKIWVFPSCKTLVYITMRILTTMQSCQYSTFPSTQESLILPFYSHTYFLPFSLSSSAGTSVIHRLSLLMVSHVFHRLSLFFILFSLFFSNWIIQMFYLCAHWFFLPHDLVYWQCSLLNSSVKSLYTSAPNFLFVFLKNVFSLLNFSFCFCIVFLTSLDYLICALL